ncbi:phosphoserine phosphatase SerB [Ornithinimicrobium pratense]|uniref:phosphoserine phosphatase n=1 Tax=Ornithinimicrobium pratense TaxID=2593973 RepID=A0A5J6V5U5_9MICO|nr:phosphoserine phosphatase SerB [Ornithinimicrobium pratense]QFG68967.1 phosphoserine phosphatase SerB [Ornithinimicrobium pratense]
MPVLTLLAPPTRPDLTDAAVRQAAAGRTLAEVRWLAAGSAVVARVGGPDAVDEEAWARWQEQGVDLVVQPDGPRRRRVLVADMDSTMIEQECIDELAAYAGVGDRVAHITARAMNGELDFAAALHERVALLRDLPESLIATVIEERVTFTPGGEVLVATMRAQGAYTALVSGGFTQFTQAVAARLGFQEHRANTLQTRDGRLTGEVMPPVLGKEAKVATLEQIVARLGLHTRDVLAVGDGANDLPMLQRAGTGLALHAKPVVATQVPVRVNHADLTAALFLQGYAEQEFVRPA